MEELGNSIPVAESLIDAEQRGDQSPGNRCLNCGTVLTDKFCPHCGQKNIPRRQTLGELIENFIGSFFSYESKFFKTIKFLLFKPGFLALEYNAGRRESYYHPARMYVFVSFLYFLLYFSIPSDTNLDKGDAEDVVLAKTDSVKRGFGLMDSNYKNKAQYDSAQAAMPVDEREGWFMRKARHRSFEIKEKYGDDENRFGKQFSELFGANSPKIFFFLLPFFALLLKFFYRKKDFYYSEHLVLSIYFYNFFFVVGTLFMLLELIPGLEWVSDLMPWLVAIYFVLALKKVYQQGWGKTVLKFVLFSSVFFVLIGIGLIVNLLITIMLI